MTNKQKFLLVDEDGSESQISPDITTKLVSLLYRKHFHTCFNCHRIFCNPSLYTNHLKRCLSSTSTDFADVVKLSTLVKLQQKAQFKCLKCKTLFPSEEVLLTHYKACLIYNCAECSKQFASDGTLKIHFLTKHCEGNQNLLRKHVFTCESCSKEYLESLESIYAYYPKYNKIMCNNCKLSIPSLDGNLIPTKVKCAPSSLAIGIRLPKMLKNNPSSDSDSSIARSIPEPMDTEPDIPSFLADVPKRGKPRKTSKRLKKKSAVSLIQQNATPTSNALIQYESQINALFEAITTKEFKSCNYCKICESKYRSIRFLKSHYSKTHSLEMLLTSPLTQACSYCECQSSSFEVIIKHMYDKHTPFVKCKHCDHLFSSVQERNDHKKAFHSGASKCRYCAVIFHSKEKKKRHSSWHLTEEDVKCETCDKVFMGIKKLKIHQVHHKLKLNSSKGLCVHCGKVVNNLSRHISRSHQKKLCLTCGKLLSESVYQYHKNVLHKNFKDTSVQCSTCGEMQKSYKHYHYHRRMVHEKHLFVNCLTCPRRFPFPSYLKKHTETCRGKKRNKFKSEHINGPNKCDACGESFSTENILMKHLRKQHGKVVRRFACRHCPDMFIRNDARISHERIHTGERPYSCSVCGQRFRQITDCKRHEDRHSGKTVPRPKKVKKNPPTQRVLEEVSEDLGYYVEYESKLEKTNVTAKK